MQTPRNRPWAAFPFLLRDSTPLRLLHHLDYLTSLLAAHTANATASSSKSEAIFPKVGYFEVAIGAGSVGVVRQQHSPPLLFMKCVRCARWADPMVARDNSTEWATWGGGRPLLDITPMMADCTTM
uniref:Uncharacterized protein n=1 Tax=Lotharella globosa TaxID=91324 RepID=A0A7S3YHU9_9EUKA